MIPRSEFPDQASPAEPELEAAFKAALGDGDGAVAVREAIRMAGTGTPNARGQPLPRPRMQPECAPGPLASAGDIWTL